MPLGIEGPEKQKHAEDKTEIADAVDDKSLVAGARVVVIGVPKTDERIRTQAHAFPTDEEQQQTIAQNQRKHRRGEQVEIGKEAPKRIVVVHVAGGVDVDETADAGDDEDHHRRKRIDQKSHVDLKRTEVNPAIEIVDEKALFRLERFQNKKGI